MDKNISAIIDRLCKDAIEKNPSSQQIHYPNINDKVLEIYKDFRDQLGNYDEAKKFNDFVFGQLKMLYPDDDFSLELIGDLSERLMHFTAFMPQDLYKCINQPDEFKNPKVTQKLDDLANQLVQQYGISTQRKLIEFLNLAFNIKCTIYSLYYKCYCDDVAEDVKDKDLVLIEHLSNFYGNDSIAKMDETTEGIEHRKTYLQSLVR